ncbi:MAG: hypothetical protein JWO80_1561 [Bryobacterales bacterium]|nr:hypothetical protein [Bryobacterales bacterium]
MHHTTKNRRTGHRFPWAVALALLLTGCSANKQAVSFAPLEDEFVYTTLSFSPIDASAQGYHTHQGANLDTALDDLSRQAINRRRDFYSSFHQRLANVDVNRLPPEDRADYDIIQNELGLALFDLDIAQTWNHNPTRYVELIGSALFNPYILDYAPKPERAKHIIARLEKVPAFCETAQRNLFRAPAIWIKVAREENEGNIQLVDKTLRSFIPEADKPAYDHAALGALDALRAFDHFMGTELPRRGGRGDNVPDWRLGENYATKFRLALATDLTPDRVLATAEADLKAVRGRMFDLSKQVLAAHSKPVDGDINKTIAAALDLIAQRHSTPDAFLKEARGDLGEAREFVRQKNLVTPPARDNLQVIETPPFLRGIYSVAGFNPAPALQPELGAFYWVTPVPKDWDKARVESKLREDNFYAFKLITIHEAMPGHYVQFEFANNVQPKTRRILRAVIGNNPYIEGWAQYATQTMLDAGFFGDSPELRLAFEKQELRVLANAIMDIRLQTNRMTEQQAMDLMEKETFQEHQEAVGKYQRAQLSSAQLPTYLVGWRDWIRVRDQYKSWKGGAFQLHDFHDAALKEGAVPLPVLFRLLTGKALGQ